MGIGGAIKLFAWILGFIVLFYLFSIWFTGKIEGKFGLAPAKKTCLGFIVSPVSVESLPNAHVSFGFFGKTYLYEIDHSIKTGYCLGQAEGEVES